MANLKSLIVTRPICYEAHPDSAVKGENRRRLTACHAGRDVKASSGGGAWMAAVLPASYASKMGIKSRFHENFI